ncbi:eukaryotic porin-domain-containing protein [Neurospora tetraspora]|uniref:Eukaryotic porin-domain-containing protein n=1 Tax=Neurospora tetraspora TaxID=94610 RepID=A0AAE0MUW5_9PEZI|nr:eukaryotic porin-domain-containing protein [Neurospora tetraspora]
MAVPAFSDIAKSANDLLNKDFYHLSAGTIEVKSNTPNNVAFKVTGKSSHDKATSGALEGKFTDKPNGTYHPSLTSSSSFSAPFSGHLPPGGPLPPAYCCAHRCFHGFEKTKQSTPPGYCIVHRRVHQSDKARNCRPDGSSAAGDNGTANVKPKQRISAPVRPPVETNFSLDGIMGPRIWGRPVNFSFYYSPYANHTTMLMYWRTTGLTVTQTWNTANALETKVEMADNLAKGLKAEGIFSFLPATNARGAKFNLHFKQSNFHGRAFFDLLKGPTANIDAIVGHEGFLAGASAGYDVQKAAITGYSAAVGYHAPTYSAAITATDNLSVFSASYYHKVNSQVEAGSKATWNSKSGNTVGLEVATKYRIDPVSFVKGKINDRGVAAVAYNVLLREGVTLGVGASFDTQKLDQATHKVGTSFTFES